MTPPRRERQAGGRHCVRPDFGDEALQLIRALAQALPEALDDEGLARLAALVRPFISTPAPDNEAPMDRLLTVAEAASRAHVHVETIRRAVRDGRLTIAGRVGRSLRIQSAEVDRWLAGSSDGSGTIRSSPGRRIRHATQPSEYSLKAALKQTG